MDALAIIDQLDCPKGLPLKALVMASERREELAPLLIAEIQDFPRISLRARAIGRTVLYFPSAGKLGGNGSLSAARSLAPVIE